MALPWIAAGVAAVFSVAVSLFRGSTFFVPNACENVQHILQQQVMGQDMAVEFLTEVMCPHLENHLSNKLLVISVHGPPGVGKTLSHQLIAKALYNKDPAAATKCPGEHCSAYKVLYGLDYTAAEEESQVARTRQGIVDHFQEFPEGLLVIEEYDKLPCRVRGMLRQLIQHPQSANITSTRGVIMLESNLGIESLEDVQAKIRQGQLSISDADRALRGTVIDHWTRQECEAHVDTTKMVSVVDLFVPFYPLDQKAMRDILNLQLEERRARLLKTKKALLVWGGDVLDFLESQVHYYENGHPVDGAQQAAVLVKLYVNKHLKSVPDLPDQHSKTLKLLRTPNEKGLYAYLF